MQKIVLENKKREFDRLAMAECTFIPKVGVDIDEDSVTSSQSLRIEKLAEPRAINDMRFNLQHSKMQEAKRRPAPAPTTTGTVVDTVIDPSSSNVVNDIISGIANISAVSFGEDESTENPFVTGLQQQQQQQPPPKTPAADVVSTLTPSPPPPTHPPPTNRGDDSVEKTTPAKQTDLSLNSDVTPPEDSKKSKKDQLEDFEVWQAEMAQKLNI